MLRRTFLAAGGGGLALPALAPTAGVAAVATEIIDAHTHFYRTPWPQTMPQEQRDALFMRPCLPPDLIPTAREAGVIGTVVVEASPDLEDNQWLLDLAVKEPFILGVVGRIDPSADGFEKHLERFAANPLFRGIRIYQGEIEAGLKPDATLVPRCRMLADRGLVLDVVGDAAVIGLATRLAAEVPALRIVIDHVGNMRIDGQPPKPALREAIEVAARQPNVSCKVSAIVENVAVNPCRGTSLFTPQCSTCCGPRSGPIGSCSGATGRSGRGRTRSPGSSIQSARIGPARGPRPPPSSFMPTRERRTDSAPGHRDVRQSLRQTSASRSVGSPNVSGATPPCP